MIGIMLFSPEILFPRSLIIMVWLWQLVLVGGPDSHGGSPTSACSAVVRGAPSARWSSAPTTAASTSRRKCDAWAARPNR
jgi:hypothetical protein